MDSEEEFPLSRRFPTYLAPLVRILLFKGKYIHYTGGRHSSWPELRNRHGWLHSCCHSIFRTFEAAISELEPSQLIIFSMVKGAVMTLPMVGPTWSRVVLMSLGSDCPGCCLKGLVSVLCLILSHYQLPLVHV